MNRIKKYLVALCLLATAILGAAGVAQATVSHAPIAASRHADPCPGGYIHWAEGTGSAIWRVWWSANPNGECWVQGAIKCRHVSVGGVASYKWEHGGRVTRLNYDSGVNCPAGYSPWQGNANFQAWPVVNPYYYRCFWGACPGKR